MTSNELINISESEISLNCLIGKACRCRYNRNGLNYINKIDWPSLKTIESNVFGSIDTSILIQFNLTAYLEKLCY